MRKNAKREGAMKKAALVSIAAILLITGCGNQRTEGKKNNAHDSSVIIEIEEKVFMAQVDDIYLNSSDYLGKTIKMEGLFMRKQWNEQASCYVIRYGPGCCGTDGYVGFEVNWDLQDKASSDNREQKIYPEIGEWVEALGVLKSYKDRGVSNFYLALSELNVLEERGAVYVSQ